MNVLSRKDQLCLLKLICLFGGFRKIMEFTGLSPNTILRYLARFGEACAAIHDREVRGVAPLRVQIDETWTYVHAKRERNVGVWKKDESTKRYARVSIGKRTPPIDKRGAFFTWVGFDPDAKLLISYHVGRRGMEDGEIAVTDTWARITGRPVISTDGYPGYQSLVQQAFGSDADHVVLEKKLKRWWNPETREKGEYIVGLDKFPQNGSQADLALASTSHLERFNSTIRNDVSRCVRQTYKFSKKLENHVHALSMFAVYYNFIRSHSGLKGDFKGWTPAMKAGVTDHLWSFEDLLDEVDRYWDGKARRPLPPALPPPKVYIPLDKGKPSDLPYFVMLSHQKHEAKVHKGTCRNCRNGLGRQEASKRTDWYGFKNEREAMECARKLAPTRYSVCSICVVGHYAGNQHRSQNTHRHRRK